MVAHGGVELGLADRTRCCQEAAIAFCSSAVPPRCFWACGPGRIVSAGVAEEAPAAAWAPQL
eukprot:2928152-Alexandrium_andersonii.AAC.1